MQRMIVLLFLFFGVNIALFAQEYTTTVKGIVTNSIGKNIRVDMPASAISNDISSFGAQLDRDGTFVIRMKINAPTPAILYHANRNVDILLLPNSELTILFDAKQFHSTLKFVGKNSAGHTFLKEFNQRFVQSSYADQQLHSKAPLKYRAEMYKKQKAKKSFADQFARSGQLSQDFIDYINAKIDYEDAVHMFDYPFAYTLYNKVDNMPPLPKDYWDFLNEMPISNDIAINMPIYAEFLHQYINKKFRKTRGRMNHRSSSYYANKYAFIETELSGKARYLELGRCIMDACTNSKVDNITSEYYSFVNQTVPSSIHETVRLSYQKASKMSSGRLAPDFTLTTPEGRQVSLRDFRGKTVYLDFWATWCGPCIKEFPHSVRLKDQFRGQGVEFIYVSVDEDPNLWKSFIKKRNMSGIHVNIPGVESELGRAYNLKGVPRYIIIDRHGNIVDGNAKAPSSPQTANSLRRTTQQ